MFRRFFLAIVRFLGLASNAPDVPVRQIAQFSLKTFDDRLVAREAAKQTGVAALVNPGGRQKWLIFKCPCGCGQEIALNLMSTHFPHWRVDVRTSQLFNVHPSVDATSCGAHFWLRDGRVSWCE
jgi:hypothetical protein